MGIHRRRKMRVWMLAFQSRFRSMVWASLCARRTIAVWLVLSG